MRSAEPTCWLAEAARTAMVQAWDQLRPWSEAEAMLATVKARGYPSGALSHGDEAMLRAVLAGLATPFDDVFASDQASYNQPHPSVCLLFDQNPVTRFSGVFSSRVSQ